MVDKNVTTNEIMDFLQEHMVTKEEFGSLEGKVDSLEGKVDSLEVKVDSLEVKVGSLEEGFLDLKQEVNQRFNQHKLDFIDALDEKLGDLKGDITIMMRKEDKKLVALIEILCHKNILEEDEAKALLALQPFPQS